MARITDNLELTVWDDNNDEFDSSELAANWDAIDDDYDRPRIASEIQMYAALVDVSSPDEGTLIYLTASDGGFDAGTILRYTSSTWYPVTGVEVLNSVPSLGNFPGRIVLLESNSGGFLAWDLIKYDGVSWTKISSIASVFGRTGDIVGEPGDYLLTDISADSEHALAISGGTYMGSLDTGDEGQLLISGGVSADPSWLDRGTTGQILSSGGTSDDPSWVSLGGVYRKNTAKTVNTTTTATDLLNGEITLPAGLLGTTKVLRLSAWGDWKQNSGASRDVPRFQLLLGGTTLFDTAGTGSAVASNGSTRYPWRIVCEIQNLGATNSQWSTFTGRIGYALNTTGIQAFTTGEGLTIGHTEGSATYDGCFATAVDTTASCALLFKVSNANNNANYETKLYGALVEII